MNNRPITEDDLHSYVDNALNSVRRSEVEEYLHQHPDEQARIASYMAQRDQLRSALTSIASEPVPPELNLVSVVNGKRRIASPAWRGMAAAVLVAVGGIGGWFLHDVLRPAPTGLTALADEAAYTYQVFASDKGRPVEIKAEDQTALVKWVSNRLQRAVSVPDLSSAGYKFLGGRVIATPHGPAGMFMYDNGQGTRLVMLTRPLGSGEEARRIENSTGGVRGVTWTDNGVGYSLVGQVPPADLGPLADEMKRQLDDRI